MSLSLNNFIIFVLPIIIISAGNANHTGATWINLQIFIRLEKHIGNTVGNAIYAELH